MDIELFRQIVQIVVSIMSLIVCYYIIPYVKNEHNFKRIKQLVYTAEQVISGAGQGANKKAYVIRLAKELGIRLSEEQIEIIIEAVVGEMNKNKE